MYKKYFIKFPSGEKISLYYFEWGNDIHAQAGCSIVFQNQMLLIGGYDQKRTIAKVEHCGISKGFVQIIEKQ